MKTLRIALPKGRLMKRTLRALYEAELIESPEVEPGRKLVWTLEDQGGLNLSYELLLLKNADVPTYVEHGVADIGVCGTDVLDESDAYVHRPLTFPFGSCRISIAGRKGTDALEGAGVRPLKVATKYIQASKRWFAQAGWPVELIKLNGSVELGAVLGLADVIVDLVETGNTLRENDLEELKVIGHTQVKLITNPALTGDAHAGVCAVVDALMNALQEEKIQ